MKAATPDCVCQIIQPPQHSLFHSPHSWLLIHNISDESLTASTLTTCTKEMQPIEITLTLIFGILSNLKSSTLPGPDGIRPTFLRMLVPIISQPRATSLSLNDSYGCVPDDNHQALVTPVHQTGSPAEASNGRPISLTSIRRKRFECILRDTITGHLRRQNHRIIQAKLTVQTVSPQVVGWIRSFLANRLFQVRIYDVIFEGVVAPSGVPKDSLIDPLFILAMVNDLTCDSQLFLAMFADDTKLRGGTDNVLRSN